MYNLCQEENWTMKRRKDVFSIAHSQFKKTSTITEWEDDENCLYVMHVTKVFIWNVCRGHGQ